MFKKVIRKIINLLGYTIQEKGYSPPGYWSNKTLAELRTLFQYDMFKKTEGLEGNIVEVGVASGRSIAFLNNLCLQFGITKKIYGFDSFEGFSEPSEADSELFKNNFSKYQETYSKYSLNAANKNLVNWCGSSDNVRNIELCKGFIPESLSMYSGGKISLMNLDLDIYQPTLDSLRFFWPLLQKGGIVMLDEYDFGKDIEKWPGAKIAVDEFCEEGEIEVQKHFTGRSFLIKT